MIPVATVGVAECGGELAADGAQAGLRVSESVDRAHGHELVFPIEDVERGDLVHMLVSQEL